MGGEDLITQLLPVLGPSPGGGFNVFEVMHHGTHEKQLSNVFRWLLEIGGTHGLGDRCQRLFVEKINLGRGGESPLHAGSYTVRQEVNTSEKGDDADIADLVLESDSTVIVVEDFETSDGHGHDYSRYLAFGERGGKTGVVVLLCAVEDRSLQTDGWENAAVVTYGELLDGLMAEIDVDPGYARQNPDAFAFIRQMYRKFGSGRARMSDQHVLDFVAAMCATGEAQRYRDQRHDLASEQFASDLAQQARRHLAESRDVLRRVKSHLRNYGTTVLSAQLNKTLGDGFVEKVSASYSGIYQWTVNFDTTESFDSFGEASLQLKFGPSAWFANEQDDHWVVRVDPDQADYSRLFITRAKTRELLQSTVSLSEVLAGLTAGDTRLHDEVVVVLREG